MAALAAFLLLGGPAAPAGETVPPPEAVPIIEIPNPDYHAGTLARGEEASAVYTVKNGGTADLRLVRADASCSCIRTVILRPEIPPGEEGGVEVTYLDRNGVGETTRVIDLTTNDPRTRVVRLTFSALVEVPFGFEARTLAMGTIHHLAREAVSKRTALLFIDPGDAQLAGLVSSSPLVTAEQLGPGEAREGQQRLEIEVSVLPGLPPGPLQETITATAASGRHPPATLTVTGMITGDVEVTPDRLRLMVVETAKRKAEDDWKRIYLRGHDPERPLKVFDCRDSNGLLDLELVELIRGEKFELTVTLKADALKENSETTGTIGISTNSPSQAEITVPYSAVRHSYLKLDLGQEPEPPGTGKPADTDAEGEETLGAE